MKTTVLVSFRDKDNAKVTYFPGDEKEFDTDRAQALAARGLVKIHEEAPAETETPAEAEPKPKRNRKSKKSDAGVEVSAETETEASETPNE